MAIIIAGMKRQINDDDKSVSSEINEVLAEGADFFEND
jgi:hypothetical protein